MREFSISLKGRVNNFSLPKNQPLIPLFEAVVNSIHAIDERKKSDPSFSNGQIKISIHWDISQITFDSILPTITGFTITDNGIGFDDNNIESFLQSDSTYKEAIGGKGVGRFSWLLAFDRAEIESIYKENNEVLMRKFDFTLKNNGIEDALSDYDKLFDDNITTVKLIDYKNAYRDNVPKQAITIAMRIIEHCLSYFISELCPRIIIEDNIDGGTLNLNEIFSKNIKTDNNISKFYIDKKEFRILNVKIQEKSVNGNKLYLCADNRVVVEKDLDKYIINLDRTIYNNHGFYYIGVLSSKYLDDNVDMNRLSFNIPENGENNSEISIEKIIKRSKDIIEEYLKEYLVPIGIKKKERIEQYITKTAPEFRHLLKYMPDDINSIKPNLTEEKLDDELYQIKRKFDKQVKSTNEDILYKLKIGAIGFNEYETLLNEQISKVSDANGAVLAEYVAHRKVIIDLLDIGIKKNEDGKFNKESFIHNIIYPMKSSSDIVDYNNHNLWLIDESLAYSSYICSDVPFDSKGNNQRPDLLVLDSPVAVAEISNTGMAFDSITIFELKRPMRNDYNGQSNPISQMYEYVEKIQQGKVTDINGRPIIVSENTKFYLYAICDITSTLKSVLKQHSFKQTPDLMGYYVYNEAYSAYVEVLPFDKIINSAKQRNKILFDKLGI